MAQSTFGSAAAAMPSELPRKRPVANREAYPSDVVDSDLSPLGRLAYTMLSTQHVHHPKLGKPGGDRPYTGEARVTDESFAKELGGVNKRTIQRVRKELLEKNYACLPEGDSGGRSNKLICYHLHPDGKSCNRPRVALKQRDAAAGANQKRAERRAERVGSAAKKDDTSVILSEMHSPPERMTKTTEKDDKFARKDDKNDLAYKEEPSFQTIWLPSTATRARGADAVVAEHSLISQLNSPEVQWHFRAMQAMLRDELSGAGKARILKAALQDGFTLGQLTLAFANLRAGRDLAGGLIVFAENWLIETAGYDSLNSCAKCSGTGVIFWPGSPFRHESAPCDCVELWMVGECFRHFEGWKIHSSQCLPFCISCGNTGWRDIETPCHCEIGVSRATETTQAGRPHEEPSVPPAARETTGFHGRKNGSLAPHQPEPPVEPGACDWCRGMALSDKPCIKCHGSGKLRTPEELKAAGLCRHCSGSGRIAGLRCPRCNGSGEAQARAYPNRKPASRSEPEAAGPTVEHSTNTSG